VRATKVNAGLAESNGRLLLGIWRDSLHVSCGLTACKPGSALGPTLGNEYGKTLPVYPLSARIFLHLPPPLCMEIGEGGIWHIQEIYARPRPHPQLDLKGATSTGKAGNGSGRKGGWGRHSLARSLAQSTRRHCCSIRPDLVSTRPCLSLRGRVLAPRAGR